MNRHTRFAATAANMALILSGLVVCAAPSSLMAKPKKKHPAPQQDQIDVIGKLPLAGGPVSRLLTTRHWGQRYLYAEQGSQGVLTLIDVTDASHPQVLSNIKIASSQGTGSIVAATGDAALVSSQPETGLSSPPSSQTLTILSVADRQNPQVVQQIANVTAMTADDDRNLIFIANGEGLWVLHRNPAPDPAVEEYFDRYVLGDR